MPVTVLHFLYAGPRAVFVLAEYIPFVGFLPIYTVAALCYDKARGKATVIDVAGTPVAPPLLPVEVPSFSVQKQHTGMDASVEDRLRKLEELFRQKLISEAEYGTQKQRILEEL